MDCPFGSPDWVCDGDTEKCFQCADADHSNRHPSGDVEDCRECKMASIQLSPSCRGQARNSIAPRTGSNSWEKGIATDHRGLPYRDQATGAPIPLKKFANHRSGYEESIRANRNGALTKVGA